MQAMAHIDRVHKSVRLAEDGTAGLYHSHEVISEVVGGGAGEPGSAPISTNRETQRDTLLTHSLLVSNRLADDEMHALVNEARENSLHRHSLTNPMTESARRLLSHVP